MDLTKEDKNMSKIDQLIDWLKYRKQHEYEESIPLLMYIGGFISRLAIILQVLGFLIFLPMLYFQPFSSNEIIAKIYKISFIELIIAFLMQLLEPLINQWLFSLRKHYAKHILAVGMSILIITIPLAWWYYYRKENVVRYFNQFKETEE